MESPLPLACSGCHSGRRVLACLPSASPGPGPPRAGEPTLPRCETSRGSESVGAVWLAGPLPSAGGWGGARARVVASPPFSPRVLISGIDRKLQGQLNALRFRVLVRPERLQTAPQSLGGLRRGDLWHPLTRKSPRAITVGGRGCAAPPPPRPPPPPLRLAGKEGLSSSEHSPDPRPLETTKQGGGGIRGGRWAPRGRRQERVSWPSAGPEASACGSLGAVNVFFTTCHVVHPIPQQTGRPILCFSLSASIPPLEAASCFWSFPIQMLISFAPQWSLSKWGQQRGRADNGKC